MARSQDSSSIIMTVVALPSNIVTCQYTSSGHRYQDGAAQIPGQDSLHFLPVLQQFESLESEQNGGDGSSERSGLQH